MRYILLIMAAHLQKASKPESLSTHMIYFSVCKIVNHVECLPLSGAHTTIYFCLHACNYCTSCCDAYQHASDSFLTTAFGLSANGCDTVGTWVEKPRREKTGRVWVDVWL